MGWQAILEEALRRVRRSARQMLPVPRSMRSAHVAVVSNVNRPHKDGSHPLAPDRSDKRRSRKALAWPWRRAAGVVLATVLLQIATPATADGFSNDGPPIRDAWGEIGLMDVPNARLTQDGELSFTFAALQNTQRYNFGFQVLPWAEAYFRYGHIDGTNGFFDYHRNLGFKIRLFDETDYTPAVVVGARDIIGTGRQGAEYLVASKQIWDLDVTAGMGWGRLAGNTVFENPFALIFPSFKTRALQPITGGTPDYGQLFHGEFVGIFGGIDWKTPIDRLHLIAEYSSDKYTTETEFGIMKDRSPFNIGLSYAPLDDIRISAGWLYGSTFSASLEYTKDPTQSVFPSRIGPPKPPPFIRTDEQQVDAVNRLLRHGSPEMSAQARRQLDLDQALLSEVRGVVDSEIDGRTLLINAVYYKDAASQCGDYARVVAVNDAQVDSIALTDPGDPSGSVSLCHVVRPDRTRLINASADVRTDPVAAKLRADVAGQQLQLDAFSIDQSEVWLYYRNQRYLSQTQAAGRLVRVLMNDMPARIEVFHLILVEHGVAVREFQLSRSAIERSAIVNGGSEELGNAVALKLPALDQPVLDAALAKAEPLFTWSLAPGLRTGFFDPLSPIQVELEAVARANLELAPGLDLSAEADGNIANNFDLKTPSASELPHVRSDIAKYLRDGINGIGSLELDYRSRLAPDVYSVVRVGYLEDMFGGVGGQVLWRPEGERVSVGVDLYQVWKRDFNRLFGFQSYNILTGHISVYYNSPWYGLNFNVHAGRYLAGDYGATIEVTRKFLTGVEIGAFATFTNVPFSKFGEGSFDKGFIVRIPFEWSLPIYTQSEKTTILHSLARDGGQRVDNDDPLYQETRDFSYGELFGRIDELTDP